MIVQAGSVDVTTYVVLRTAADGTATTGVTITDIDLQSCRSGELPSAKVDATALAAVDSAHSDNKAIEVDATDQPGLIRVDWPDAPFAAGVDEVILTVKLANSFTEHLRVELVAYDPQDTVRLGLTALPNAVADAAGGLPISDAGGLDLDAMNAAAVRLTSARAQVLTDWINGGRLDLLLDAVLADTNELQTNQGNWATATGFSTHNAAAVAALILVTPAQKLVTNVAGYVTYANAAPPTAAAVADAVWNEAYVDHTNAGSYGILVGAAFEEV